MGGKIFCVLLPPRHSNHPYAGWTAGFRIIEPLSIKGFPAAKTSLLRNPYRRFRTVRALGERLPNLISVAPVRYEIDPFAVPRPAWEEVPPCPRRDLSSLAAVHAYHINISVLSVLGVDCDFIPTR